MIQDKRQAGVLEFECAWNVKVFVRTLGTFISVIEHVERGTSSRCMFMSLTEGIHHYLAYLPNSP